MPSDELNQTRAEIVASTGSSGHAVGAALALPQNQSLISVIDAKIAAEESPQRMQFLAALRREIIDQNAIEAEGHEKLASKRRNFWFKTGFCGGTLILGAGLVAAGFSVPGFFVLGGGLAMIAPHYVRDFMQQRNKQNNQTDE
jgi:hypothetical protein